VLTVQIPEVFRPGIESQLARGEIRLHKWFDGRGLMRGVTIEKYRGSSHDSRMRHLKITQTGIVVPMAEGGKRKKSSAPEESEPEKEPKASEDAGLEKKEELPLPPPPENGMKEMRPPIASGDTTEGCDSDGSGGSPT